MATRKRRWPLVVIAFLIALDGCQAIRGYAKDLLDPRASSAVLVPVRISIGVFVLPFVVAWLPVSIVPLLAIHDEGAVWFALAPGLVLGGPFVLLAGTPGYLLTDKPGRDTMSADQAPVSSASPSGR